MALRLLLDVNVWMNHFISLSRGKPAASASRLIRAALEGHCRLGPIQVIASHAMLDTLERVLVRWGFSEFQAQAARDAAEGACEGGALRMGAVAVLGGGVQPLRDREDGSVLDAALAAEADLLVTNNFRDFAPGPRADVDGIWVEEEAVLLVNPRVPNNLTIAKVQAAHSWLINGVRPPPGVLSRLVPPEPEASLTP